MSTYCAVLEKGKRLLVQADIPEAALDAWILLEHVTGMSRSRYFLVSAKEMPAKEEETYVSLIRQRVSHKPLQHITGVQEFMGMPFFVDEHVLIPRQDTEILVETALEKIRKKPAKPKVLDLCTGSGCIGISVAKMSESEVTCSDISLEALHVAKRNAVFLGVTARMVQSDLFTDLRGEVFDYILSNPPYIRSADIETLMPEVRDFEPRTALDGKEDGLAFYRYITEAAGTYLRKGGWLMYEIGCDQAEAVSGFLRLQGYREIQVKKDYAGHDRVVFGRR